MSLVRPIVENSLVVDVVREILTLLSYESHLAEAIRDEYHLVFRNERGAYVTYSPHTTPPP